MFQLILTTYNSNKRLLVKPSRWIVLVLIVVSVYSYSQDGDYKIKEYNKAWKTVDSLNQKGLYKSSALICTEIYQKAKKENNTEQIVKALHFKLKAESEYTEEEKNAAIAFIETELNTINEPAKSLVHLLCANYYFSYYTENRWLHQDRTETSENDSAVTDITGMSPQNILKLARQHYISALTNRESLKKYPTKGFNELILHKSEFNLANSLYDLTMLEAIRFFTNAESQLADVKDTFLIKDSNWSNDSFYLNAKLSFNELNSNTKIQSILFAELLVKQKNEPLAFTYTKMQQLQHFWTQSNELNKDSIYESAIRKVMQTYSGNEYPIAAKQLTELYLNLANNKTKEGKPQNKWIKKEALNLITQTINKYPKGIETNWFKYQQEFIIRPEIKVQTTSIIPVNTLTPMLVEFRNTNTGRFRIVFNGKSGHTLLTNISSSKGLKTLLKQPIVKEWSIQLPNDSDYYEHTAETALYGLEPGEYLLLSTTAKSFTEATEGINCTHFTVTNLAYTWKKLNNQTIQLHVVNRKTGEPIANANVSVEKQNYNYTAKKYEMVTLAKFVTNTDGRGVYTRSEVENQSLFVSITKDNDSYHSSGLYLYDYSQPIVPEQSVILTDRAIYRPGQTLYFKDILYQRKDGRVSVIKNKTVTLSLKDANYQDIATLTLTTNEFGSCNGSFVIPNNVLTGSFSLEDGLNVKNISVEEYKRPKFEVNLYQPKGAYKLNEDVLLTGKAVSFAGAALTNAKVKYTITRSVTFPHYWYWKGHFNQSEQKILVTNEIATNDTGGFQIAFKALTDENVSLKDYPTFIYSVEAVVSDINGESHTATTDILVGTTAINVLLNLEENCSTQSLVKSEINTTNNSGVFESTTLEICLQELVPVKTKLYKKLWNQPEINLYNQTEYHQLFPGYIYKNDGELDAYSTARILKTITYTTQQLKEVNWKNQLGLAQILPGYYRISIKTTDKYGTPIEITRSFSYSTPTEIKLSPTSQYQATLNKEVYQPGDTLILSILSNYKNGLLNLSVSEKNNPDEDELTETVNKWITLQNGYFQYKMLVTEKHQGGFGLQLWGFINNNYWEQELNVRVPFVNKQLSVEFETFRDKLEPGQKEEWKIRITQNGRTAQAEILASMYDASLDEFAPNYWQQDFYSTHYPQNPVNTSYQGYASQSYYLTYFKDRIPYPQDRELPLIKWISPEINYSANGEIYLTLSTGLAGNYNATTTEQPSIPQKHHNKRNLAAANKSKNILPDAHDVVAGTLTTTSIQTQGYSISKDKEEDENIRKGENYLPTVKVRTQLNENAFFYPTLKTNEKGEVFISFTSPESLTKWKTQLFAHTTDLSVGYTEKALVTQKQLMVTPNYPRFVRNGDELLLSAKIDNLTSMDTKALCSLSFANPLNNQKTQLSGNEEEQKEITIKKNSSAIVEWKIKIPLELDLLACTLTAKGKEHSDGEQMIIPVLSNQILVTETFPVWVNGIEPKTFNFEHLLNNRSTSLQSKTLTLEFTPNPAWYSLQALPYLMEYPYECSEQLFSRYYSNTLASHLINSKPLIKAVINKWKTYTPQALYANLQKNQELKTVLLKETPWVLAANNEETAKQNLALLFDLNKMQHEQNTSLEKLLKQQAPDGGWPWFAGMPSNRYITQHIIAGFAHLFSLNVINPEEHPDLYAAITKAIQFVDEETTNEFSYRKKQNKEWEKYQLSNYDLHYLYSRSYFSKRIAFKPEARKMYDFYLSLAVKQWVLNNRFSQGLIALITHRENLLSTRNDILKSLYESSLYTEEMGRYWKENQRGFYWYESPIETQSILLEAFNTNNQYQQTVEEVKRWLIKNKQGNHWGTTKATTEAIYTLLLTGDNWLETDNLTTIKCGNQLVTTQANSEPGTGYFKTSWHNTEIKPELGKVIIQKSGNGPGYGSIYWQYLEDLNKITPAKTGIEIRKALYKTEIVNGTTKLIPFKEGNMLKIGEKIKIRIEILSDRQLEYLHLKDMRAAGFEPTTVFSGYQNSDGLSYYQTTRDIGTDFYIESISKGTYILEYELQANIAGKFTGGITTLQCMYAPEFSSHSQNITVEIQK